MIMSLAYKRLLMLTGIISFLRFFSFQSGSGMMGTVPCEHDDYEFPNREENLTTSQPSVIFHMNTNWTAAKAPAEV
jgi:hypothetical protein